MQQFQKLKEQGNAFFKQKNYLKAKQTFLQVIKNIEQSNQQYDSHVSQCGKLYVNILTNIALCCLSIKSEDQVCDKALKIDPNNQKGLYRRGIAHKELGENRQKEENMDQVPESYESAKKDLEKLCLLDRNNKLAEEKLKQTLENLARLRIINQLKKTEEKKDTKKVSTAKQEKGQSKLSMKMETIMKNYKVDEVVKAAQQKTEQSILNNPLPQSKTDLDKAIKQLNKKPELLRLFFLKFTEGYLQKMDPGFDLLFNLINSLITVKFSTEEIVRFGKVVDDVVKVKSFKFVWKGLIESERKDIKEKLNPIFKVRQDLVVNFQ